MSKVKLSDNLFIGTQELKTFQENLYHFRTILGYLTKHYGFVDLRDSLKSDEDEDNCWKVTANPSGGSFSISSPSYAFAYPNNLITWNNNSKEIKVPDSFKGKTFWVKIKYAEDNFEQGKITLKDNQGNVTGENTVFTEKLRGEPNFASMIELFAYDSASGSWISKGQYMIESVTTDTSMKLSSNNGLPSSSISYLYKVVGTFPVGTVLNQDIIYPFVYDSCEVELVEETTAGQAPSEGMMMVNNQEFYIARLTYSNQGILTVTTTDAKNYFEVSKGYDEKYSKWWSLK